MIDRLPRVRSGSTVYATAILVGLMAWDTVAFNLNTYLNHDIAWVLYSAERLLSGGAFGREVIAVNPPLIWWLSEPVVILSRWTELSVPTAFTYMVAVASCGVLAWVYYIVKSKGLLTGKFARPVFLLSLAFILFPASYRDFGQREYIALLCSLPYALGVAARLRGRSPSRSHAVVIGVVAGLGFSLKPYFFAVPLFAEAVLFLHVRRIRSVIRAETVAIAVTVAFYLAAIWLFAPIWLTEVVPIARNTYGAFERPIGAMLWSTVPYAAGLTLVAVSQVRFETSATIRVLLSVTLGFGVSYVVQLKGYSYHAFPLRSLTIVLLALTVVRQIESLRSSSLALFPTVRLTCNAGALILLVAGSVVTTAAWRDYMSPGGAYRQVTDQIVSLVDSRAGGGFLALSTHPYPGFPTALYTDATWVARTNSRLLLPAVALARSRDGADSRTKEIERSAWQMLVEDLERDPQLLLVDSSLYHHGIEGIEFDLLGFYREDPRVRLLMSKYDELEPVERYRVFVRTERSYERE